MVSQGGRGGEGVGHTVLKKGPWTAAEDAVLLEYVKRQGEGNWNAVQKNSGLQRCGKSCRLRWANHLRPFLKKGPFTPDEEKTIIDLHSKIGNKWARMAAQVINLSQLYNTCICIYDNYHSYLVCVTFLDYILIMTAFL